MAHPAASVRRRILIDGRVQGVGFRYATVREGRRLGLRGFARNLADGRVEVIAEGPAEDVDRLTAWCHRGPPAAQVTSVEHSDIAAAGEPLEAFGMRW
jgi:acylphosphatase